MNSGPLLLVNAGGNSFPDQPGLVSLPDSMRGRLVRNSIPPDQPPVRRAASSSFSPPPTFISPFFSLRGHGVFPNFIVGRKMASY